MIQGGNGRRPAASAVAMSAFSFTTLTRLIQSQAFPNTLSLARQLIRRPRTTHIGGLPA